MVGAKNGIIEGKPARRPAKKHFIISDISSEPCSGEKAFLPVLISVREKWIWPEHPGRFS